MPHPQFDRSRVRMAPLAERENRIRIEDACVGPSSALSSACSRAAEETLNHTVQRILQARKAGRPVVVAFGAHTIKNGLAPLLIALLERGWFSHLATNGAGIIHDWEFSYLWQSSEHVGANVAKGMFGNWQETGYYINLALNVGAFEGRGYGESVGAFIQNEGLDIPSESDLLEVINDADTANTDRIGAAADLLGIVRRLELTPGHLDIPHRWKKHSLQAAAYRLSTPFTAHPMFGHDIIYNHPMNCGPAIGRGAQRDFLSYVHSISRLDGGVYLSVGSAIMSPMIFEKSLSMSQNVAIQRGESIRDHYILAVDLAASDWDWSTGEPPHDDPAYYLRYNKSFSRMGGTMRYLQMDNRDFFLHLWQRLAAS